MKLSHCRDIEVSTSQTGRWSSNPLGDPLESLVKMVMVMVMATVILTHLLTHLLTIHKDSGLPFAPCYVPSSLVPSWQSFYYSGLGQVQLLGNGPHAKSIFRVLLIICLLQELCFLNLFLLPLLISFVFVTHGISFLLSCLMHLSTFTFLGEFLFNHRANVTLSCYMGDIGDTRF